MLESLYVKRNAVDITPDSGNGEPGVFTHLLQDRGGDGKVRRGLVEMIAVMGRNRWMATLC